MGGGYPPYPPPLYPPLQGVCFMDYSQKLPRFNLGKLLKMCSIEERQPYGPKPAAVETVDPNRISTTFISYFTPSTKFWELAEGYVLQIKKQSAWPDYFKLNLPM